MLVTIFGPDGVGKTTQIKKLLSVYQQAGLSTASIYDVMPNFDYKIGTDLNQYYQYFKNFDVIHTRFRLHSYESAQIMNILEVIPIGTDIKLAALSAYVAYYSYVQWSKYVLNPLLADGKLLFCDKYYYDDIATKAAFGCPYEWLKSLHYDTQKPALGLYMQLDGSTLIKRNWHRGDGRIVHYQSNTGVERLLYYYEQLVIDEGLTSINANRDSDSITKDILDKLQDIGLAPEQYRNHLKQHSTNIKIEN